MKDNLFWIMMWCLLIGCLAYYSNVAKASVTSRPYTVGCP